MRLKNLLIHDHNSNQVSDVISPTMSPFTNRSVCVCVCGAIVMLYLHWSESLCFTGGVLLCLTSFLCGADWQSVNNQGINKLLCCCCGEETVVCWRQLQPWTGVMCVCVCLTMISPLLILIFKTLNLWTVCDLFTVEDLVGSRARLCLHVLQGGAASWQHDLLYNCPVCSSMHVLLLSHSAAQWLHHVTAGSVSSFSPACGFIRY